MPRVLCTGVDKSWREMRKRILEESGHVVTTAMNALDVAGACKRNHFDVAIIGHKIVPNEKPRNTDARSRELSQSEGSGAVPALDRQDF